MLAADGGESSAQATGSGAGHAFSRPGRWASRYPQPSASPGRTSPREPGPRSWQLARSTTSVHLSDGRPRRTAAAQNGGSRATSVTSNRYGTRLAFTRPMNRTPNRNAY